MVFPSSPASHLSSKPFPQCFTEDIPIDTFSKPVYCSFLHGFLSPCRSQWMNRTLTLMWVHWQTCTPTRTSTRARRTRHCWRTSDRPFRASRSSPEYQMQSKNNYLKKVIRGRMGCFLASVIYHSSFISSAVMLSTPWVSFLLFWLLLPCFEKQHFKQTFTFCTFSYDPI